MAINNLSLADRLKIIFYYLQHKIHQSKNYSSSIWSLFNRTLWQQLQRECDNPNSDFFRGYLPSYYLNRKKFTNYQSLGSIYKRILVIRDHELCRSDQQSNRQIRVLVIRRGALGDVIMLIPVISELWESRAGEISIDIATNFPEVFSSNPHARKADTLGKIQQEKNHYDNIIDLDFSYERFPESHPTQIYAKFVLNSGLRRQPKIYFEREDLEMSYKLLAIKSNIKYVVAHSRYDINQPFRGVAPKIWESYLYKLTKELDCTIIHIGDPFLDTYVNLDGQSIDARGKLSLSQTCALISKAEVFVGFDAGPMHIAACTNTPIAAFFTQVSHQCREPLREAGTIFVPLVPTLDCYGCAKNHPATGGFYCKRRDSICSQSFDVDECVRKTILALRGHNFTRE